ncbi:MAG: type III-B CRISPR module-associated protein Cmr5 [Pirellula sp.]
MRQTMDQQRAKYAWEMVSQAVTLKKEDGKSYGRHARRLGSRILASGLGHAIAFLEQKKEAPTLVRGISLWIARQRWAGEDNDKADPSITRMIIDKDREFQRLATEETMNLLVWIVRFAVAKGLTDEDQNDDPAANRETTT